MSIKIYEYGIFEHLFDPTTVKSLAEEAWRGHQYGDAIVTLERKHAIEFRDLVRPLVVKEAREDIFQRIDQLLIAYKPAKKALVESQKKTGKQKVTRKERTETEENTDLRALKNQLNGAKKLRDATTEIVLEKFFYQYDAQVQHFSDIEKIKYLCDHDFVKVSSVCPELAVKHARDYTALAQAIIQDRNALYEQSKQLKREQRQCQKAGTTFTKQALLDGITLSIKAYNTLDVSDNHLKRTLKLQAIDAIVARYPTARGWKQLIKIRRKIDELEHEFGKQKFPCSTATFAHVLDARKRARKDSLGGNGSAVSLPFCGWDKKLPHSNSFDGTVICGWQMRLEEQDSREGKKVKLCTPTELFSGNISKFVARVTSSVPLDGKHFRARKVAQAGISRGWSPQVYTVDMLLRGKSKSKGIVEDDRIKFDVLIHREMPPNSNVREVYIKVWKKCAKLRYTLQLVVDVPDQLLSVVDPKKQDALAIVPRWHAHGEHDLVVASTFPATRGSDLIVVCDSAKQHDGSYTNLSKHKTSVYRKKRDYAMSLQKVSDSYFDKAKERLYNIYTKDQNAQKVFDNVLAALSKAHPSYSKVKLAYANRWRDHRKFRGFANALLEHYFDVPVINEDVWGMWRAHRFCGHKSAFDARAAKCVPSDLFHDNSYSMAENSASRDGWNDVTVWVDVNYKRLSALAKCPVSKKLLCFAVYFYFWAKKDDHLDILISRTNEKAISWRNDCYSKRAHEIAGDYQYCILVKQDLRRVAEDPEFEYDDRSKAQVASNKLRQMVAPSEFIAALKSVFGNRVVFVPKKAYEQAVASRNKSGLEITDAQLLHSLGVKQLGLTGTSRKGARRIASAKVMAK